MTPRDRATIVAAWAFRSLAAVDRGAASMGEWQARLEEEIALAIEVAVREAELAAYERAARLATGTVLAKGIRELGRK